MIHLNITSGDFVYNELFYNVGVLLSQCVGTPINLFTLFVIWRFSTPDMKGYKKHLMVYQFTSMCLDFSVDTLATPVFFFPLPAGTCQGVLRKVFGLSTYHIFIIMFTIISGSFHFICADLIFYRWQIILPIEHWLKFQTTTTFSLAAYGYLPIAAFIPAICYLLGEQDEVTMKRQFRELNPKDAYLADIDGFYWENLQENPTVALALIWHTIMFGVMVAVFFFTTAHSVTILRDYSHSMSQTTRKMHFRFLKQVVVQTITPTIMLYFPPTYWMHVIQYEIRFLGMQNMTNFTMLMISMHGAVASLFLLFLNKCYTHALFSMFVRPVRKLLGLKSPQSSVIQVSPSNISPSQLENDLSQA